MSRNKILKKRICIKCKNNLFLTRKYFYTRKDRRNRFRTVCKKCILKYYKNNRPHNDYKTPKYKFYMYRAGAKRRNIFWGLSNVKKMITYPQPSDLWLSWGEKKYMCDLCGQWFTASRGECDYCGKNYAEEIEEEGLDI